MAVQDAAAPLGIALRRVHRIETVRGRSLGDLAVDPEGDVVVATSEALADHRGQLLRDDTVTRQFEGEDVHVPLAYRAAGLVVEVAVAAGVDIAGREKLFDDGADPDVLLLLEERKSVVRPVRTLGEGLQAATVSLRDLAGLDGLAVAVVVWKLAPGAVRVDLDEDRPGEHGEGDLALGDLLAGEVGCDCVVGIWHGNSSCGTKAARCCRGLWSLDSGF